MCQKREGAGAKRLKEPEAAFSPPCSAVLLHSLGAVPVPWGLTVPVPEGTNAGELGSALGARNTLCSRTPRQREGHRAAGHSPTGSDHTGNSDTQEPPSQSMIYLGPG